MAPRPVFFLESEDYSRRTGGWAYNNRLVEQLGRNGLTVTPCILPPFFELANDDWLAQTGAVLALLPAGAIVLTDHLYATDLSDAIGRVGLNLISIFHHPSTEEDASADGERERAAFVEARMIVCSSTTTARFLVETAKVAGDRIVVAPPGLDAAPISPTFAGGQWNMLSVGAVVPRKRYILLVEALARLTSEDWRWTIVGNLTRQPACVTELRNAIGAHGLTDRVYLRGEVDDAELGSLWQRSHLFLAASAHEGYGLAVAEGLRRGIPVVTTKSGAVAEWAGSGACIVHTDTPEAICAEIAAIVGDPQRYKAEQERALAAGGSLPHWDEALAPAVTAIRRLAEQ